jgi:hypothetical protein
MATSQSGTPKVRAKLAAVPSVPAADSKPSIGSDEHPINIINDRLDRAYATLDLLYSIMLDERGVHIVESLCTDTLQTVMHDAMQNVREAQEAANRKVGA